MLTSIEVRFFRFRPWAAILSMEAEVPVVESASANYFLGKGINLPKCLNFCPVFTNKELSKT